MSIGDELLYDFDFKRPRVLIGGRFGVVDNVKDWFSSAKNRLSQTAGLFLYLYRAKSFLLTAWKTIECI